jgi:hypothetical protein
MGKKMNFIIIIVSMLLGAAGCADFELYIKKEARGVKPSVIIIGQFDIRNMDYDPYISEEFRDALKFEFFRRGYNSVLIPRGDIVPVKESEWAAKICSTNSGDILIKGVISQRESGFLANREVETLLSFTVYGKDGAVLGEGFYHDNDSAGNESLRRGAADRFVTGLLKNMGQAD